jgi:hypothetical protein
VPQYNRTVLPSDSPSGIPPLPPATCSIRSRNGTSLTARRGRSFHRCPRVTHSITTHGGRALACCNRGNASGVASWYFSQRRPPC